MDQRGATVRDDEIPQAVCVGHQVDGRGSIARLHVMVGNDDHYGFRPSILHRIEQLTDGPVRGGVTRLSGAALWSVVMPDRVGFIEMPENQLDRRVAERLQQVRHDLRVQGIAVGIQRGARWNDPVRRPAPARGSGGEEPAIIAHHSCTANPCGPAGIKDGWHSRSFDAGPVRQPGIAPRGGSNPVRPRITPGQERTEARVGG